MCRSLSTWFCKLLICAHRMQQQRGNTASRVHRCREWLPSHLRSGRSSCQHDACTRCAPSSSQAVSTKQWAQRWPPATPPPLNAGARALSTLVFFSGSCAAWLQFSWHCSLPRSVMFLDPQTQLHISYLSLQSQLL
jgi:hypothetical protein